MACTTEQKATLDKINGLPKGVDVIYKDTPVPGDDSRTNNLLIDGTQTLIEGKDIKLVEWTKGDTFKMVGKFIGAGLLGIIFPPAMILMHISNIKTVFTKIDQLNKQYEKGTDFFREEVREQFDERFNSKYQDCKADEHRMTDRIESATARISDLSDRINALPANDPQRGALESEINRLKVELEGDGKTAGLIQERDELRADMAKMEVAIEEIKDASTTYGYPSLETLALFNKHASYTDAKGEFHPGELFRDVEGAQGYISELFNQYMSDDAPHASAINDLINNLDSLKPGAEQLGVVGLNVTNMDKAEAFVNLIECMPNDCNPREVISDKMAELARDANSALSNIDFSAFTTDPQYAAAAEAFNERFAAAEDRLEHLQNKHDNDRSHKGGNNSHNPNHSHTNNPNDPNNPNSPFNPSNNGGTV